MFDARVGRTDDPEHGPLRRLRRLFPFDRPQEVTFFLFLAAFALVITIVYWFASYEPAGTVLLAGFTIATGAVGLRLAVDPRAKIVQERAERDRVAADGPIVPPDLADRKDPGGEGPTSGGPGGIDRPFLDEEGRLPGETLAPFAVGLGVAIAATGTIFGLPPRARRAAAHSAGAAWAWLGGASEELDATERDADRAGRASGRRGDPQATPVPPGGKTVAEYPEIRKP